MILNIKLVLIGIAFCIFGRSQIGAQEADFWPFQVGNVWEYQHLQGVEEYAENGEERFVVTTSQVLLRIDATATIAGKTYFRFNNGQLLRKDNAGNVYEYSYGPAEGYAYLFANGVGLVLSFQGSDTPVLNRYELVSATIDGKDRPTYLESSNSWGSIKLRQR